MSLSWLKRNLFWANDSLHGRKIGQFYDDLRRVNSSYETGFAIQQEHLRALLNHATANSQFYRETSNCGEEKKNRQLSDFIVVNKTVLSQNHDKVRVPIDKIPGQEGTSVHVQRTSGSTGTPFAVLQDTRKRNRRIAELKFYNAEVGVLSHEMIGQCRIWTKWQSKSKWQSFRENIVPINVAKMDDDTCAFLFDSVRRRRIVLLRAYASWYDAVVKYLEEGKGNPNDLKSLKVCLSSSEALNEETREKMLKLTGVPIVEAYADEEGGVLAQQRIGDSNYYLNHSGYVFEFLKLDEDQPANEGELARVVITDLFNYAFPLIRYDTGDTAIYSKGNDKSGGWVYIGSLYGRRLDLVHDTKGVAVHPMNFARILKNLPGIIQWQFIQKGEKDYLIKLNMEKGYDAGETVDRIKSVLGADANVLVEYVNDIPVLASGKRKPVVCEWKK